MEKCEAKDRDSLWLWLQLRAKTGDAVSVEEKDPGEAVGLWREVAGLAERLVKVSREILELCDDAMDNMMLLLLEEFGAPGKLEMWGERKVVYLKMAPGPIGWKMNRTVDIDPRTPLYRAYRFVRNHSKWSRSNLLKARSIQLWVERHIQELEEEAGNAKGVAVVRFT